MAGKKEKIDILDPKQNPWYNWTFPEKTTKVYCVSCGKRIKTHADKVAHSWARLCDKCNKKHPVLWSRS